MIPMLIGVLHQVVRPGAARWAIVDGMGNPEAKRTEAHRQALIAERDELRAAGKASKPERTPVALDQQSVGRLSRMDALQVQAMAVAAEGRRQARIHRIEAALTRVEDGEFGWCVTCGEDIAPGRLAMDPSVPTCIACAKGAE